MTEKIQEYLTTQEMADCLKISLGAMYKLMHSHDDFPKIKVLSDYRFIESEVKKYLECKDKK
jgi:excisionase family DNA binding protein